VQHAWEGMVNNNSRLRLVKTGYDWVVTGRGYDWVATGSNCSCDRCNRFSHGFGLGFDIFGNAVTGSGSGCPNLGKKPDLTGLSITIKDQRDGKGQTVEIDQTRHRKQTRA
jgi:hypothetical protein